MSDILPTPKDFSDPSRNLCFFGTTTPSREQIARFLVKNADIIIYHVQRVVLAQHFRGGEGRLRGFDPEDILGTVYRRIDAEIASGRVRTEFEFGFWSYVLTVAENAAREKLRKHQLISLDAPRSSTLQEIPAPPILDGRDDAYYNEHRDVRYERMKAALRRESDQDLLALKSRGLSYAAIAALTGRSQAALRKQFSTLRQFLRRRMPPPRTDPSSKALTPRAARIQIALSSVWSQSPNATLH